MTAFGLVDHISVKVPAGMSRSISMLASDAKVSRAEFIRRILCEAIDYEPPPPSPQPERAATAFPRIPERRPQPLETQTPFKLFERGYTATQIAAILRKPYRQVMAEIGEAVDGMKIEYGGKPISAYPQRRQA